MLNIYYSRDNLDKEKFIFDKLDLKHKNIIIVPDQFTLSMEEDMFSYLNVKSLITTEVTSFSKLGNDILKDMGGDKRNFIDKYGRHIILTKISKEIEGELVRFNGINRKASFINLANNFIAELKQGNINKDFFTDILSSLDENSDSYKKFKDLKLIYEKYEEAIKGKYVDTEDKIDVYLKKIPNSKKIKDANIYVYGFDSLAPKALSVLGELLEYAKNINVILSYDDKDSLFSLTGIVIDNLKNLSESKGIRCSIFEIPKEYEILDRKSGIREIEKNLFNSTYSNNLDGVTLIEAESIYNEAETIASYVLHLIRDLGYEEKDIKIITNDSDLREPILKRMFKEYGLDIFSSLDISIWDTSIVQFVVSLMEAIYKNYDSGAIIKIAKSGLSDLTIKDAMRIETYAKKYRIKYSMWKKPFSKGVTEYGDELLEIESLRQKLINPIIKFEEICKEKTVSGFINSLYGCLNNEVKISDKIDDLLKGEEEYSRFDLSLKTSQVFNSMVSILEQMKELMGDDEFSIKEFLDLFTVGLKEVKISLLPLSKDSVTLGTMERLRLGRNTKCVIIMGMNEGLIPLNMGNRTIVTDEEKEFLKEKGFNIFKTDMVTEMEENLAIYRNLSKPLDSLFVTYSKTGSDGNSINESQLFTRLREMGFELKNDIIADKDIPSMVNGNVAGLRHLAYELSKGEELPLEWVELISWYKKNKPEMYENLRKAFAFDNKIKPIGSEKAKELFGNGNDISLGPTSIEKYIKCPFNFFLSKGLKLSENKVYEFNSIDYGDFSHYVIMNFTHNMSLDGKEPADPTSRWNTVTNSEIIDLVDKIVDSKIDSFKEELFKYSEEEIYRAKRLRKTLEVTCLNLAMQVRKGQIKEIFFEEEFKRNKKFAPLVFETESGKVYIEGRIDRVDILKNDRVKIIDYKTGKDEFDKEKARIGYQVQLILYLKAAEEDRRGPAAVFYFHIADPLVDVTGKKKEKLSYEELQKEIEKKFQLSGVMLNDSQVIDSIDMEEKSTVVKRKAVLSDYEFKELEEEVIERVSRGINDLAQGKIAISPMRIKRASQINTSCDHCPYLSICRFERNAPGAKYREE